MRRVRHCFLGSHIWGIFEIKTLPKILYVLLRLLLFIVAWRVLSCKLCETLKGEECSFQAKPEITISFQSLRLAHFCTAISFSWSWGGCCQTEFPNSPVSDVCVQKDAAIRNLVLQKGRAGEHWKEISISLSVPVMPQLCNKGQLCFLA